MAAIAAGVILVAAIITALAASRHHLAAPAARATTAAHSSAACSKLAASALPMAVYDELVTRKVSQIAHGGSASRADVRTARAKVAAEVRTWCPQFSYLAHA
jgi:hypothetical protein